MRGTRALVTGGAGFIGSHVVAECLALGMEVVVADNLSGGFERNVPAGVPLRVGELEDPGFVRSLWSEGPFDWVYHLAAFAAEHLSHATRRHTYRSNVIASANLVNESVNQGVKHFVFTSSIAVYGSQVSPIHEEMIPRPEDPYGIAKYAVELDLAAAERMYGLGYTIFRPHNVYGERQNLADPHRNVVAIFVNQVRRGEPMTVFGDGRQSRAFTHVDDVAPVIARAPLVDAARNRVFNLGSDIPVTIGGLAAAVAGAAGVACRIRPLPPRLEVEHAYCTHDRVRDAFGLNGTGVELAAGLRRMLAWASTVDVGLPTPAPAFEITRPAVAAEP